MKKFLLVSLTTTGLSLVLACGRQASHAELSTTDQSTDVSVKKHEGKGYEGQPCSLEIEENADGSLKRLKFAGDFKVDYKIPAPGSGLYGVYSWDNTFDTAVHVVDSSLRVKRSLLGDADVLEGDGKPLFWDTGKIHHKLVFKPSLKDPRKVTYHSVNRLVAVVPFVVIDHECEL